jgi:RNA polymerase sigma-70 factor (ECF subfamily)
MKLELVNETRLNGKAEVSRYFDNHSKGSDWHLVPGLVEGRPKVRALAPLEG